jgi:hypothetical protein
VSSLVPLISIRCHCFKGLTGVSPVRINNFQVVASQHSLYFVHLPLSVHTSVHSLMADALDSARRFMTARKNPQNRFCGKKFARKPFG